MKRLILVATVLLLCCYTTALEHAKNKYDSTQMIKYSEESILRNVPAEVFERNSLRDIIIKPYNPSTTQLYHGFEVTPASDGIILVYIDVKYSNYIDKVSLFCWTASQFFEKVPDASLSLYYSYLKDAYAVKCENKELFVKYDYCILSLR